MKNKTDNTNARPWFREPMVWMIISIPSTAVVVGMLMLTMSIRSYDGLVADDYYKRGKEINRVLVRDQLAKEHGIGATLAVRDESVVLDLRHDGRLPLPATLELNFLHRTRAGRDRAILLTAGPDGRYHGQIDEGAPGRWFIQLETSTWRVSGEAELPLQSKVDLRAI